MANLSVILGLVILCFGSATFGLPDEERYMDKEYTRELINWLTSLNPSTTNPCRYLNNNNGGNFYGPLPKRNSELINSLLSLPKTMNDAGK